MCDTKGDFRAPSDAEFVHYPITFDGRDVLLTLVQETLIKTTCITNI